MNKIIMLGILFVSCAHANNNLMTARDVEEEKVSNITLTNRTNQIITASGIFIASYDVNDCSACTGTLIGGDNVNGSVVSFVTFKPNQPVPIGQNYLYNMIYNGIYYIKSNAGSSPCALPGCTWPGDLPNTKWCLTLNVTSLDSSYTFSNYVNGANPPANIPAYGAPGNLIISNYKYDLINPTTLGGGDACLGPVSCDDQTLNCSVSTAQNEDIEEY